jgi:PAS domain S-box-containing protein
MGFDYIEVCPDLCQHASRPSAPRLEGIDAGLEHTVSRREQRVLMLDRLQRARRALERPWPLRAYLIAFGFALILPSFLFATLGLVGFRASDREAQNRAALEIARAAANDLDSQLSGIITTLKALATSEALEQGDFASFHRQAKRALRGGNSNIVLRSVENRQLLNTRVPWGTELPTSADRPPDPENLDRDEPWVSDLLRGAIAKVPLFTVSSRVILADGRKVVLTMSRPAASLVSILQQSGLPPRWEAAISDRHHRILARSSEQERYVGQTFAPAMMQTTAAEGVRATTNLAGERVLRAFSTSGYSGWKVAVWVPIDVIDAPYRHTLRMVLLAGAGLLALSLLLAGVFARKMARPIQGIAEAAARLGQSEMIPPLAAYPLQEANAVNAALHGAAKRLAERREAMRRSEQRIREAHERLTLALDVSDLGTWDRDLTTGRIVWSEGMYRIFGRSHDQFSGTADEVLSFVHPDDRAAFRRAFQETVRTGSSGFGQDFRIVRPDGETRWVLRRAQLVRADDGQPMSMLGVALDVTERRDKEEHIAFLMRELAHRSKNLVAVIQAIAHQTARHSEDVADFIDRFSARLVSLARTQDLLTGKDRNGADLEELVESQLEPFVEASRRRLSAQGPAVVLDPAATQNIGLALHELATNAAKYGALSVPEGRVLIDWKLIGKPDGARTLHLSWRERDGPTVSQPARKGFGHVVVERTLADSLQASVTLKFSAGGLTWEAEIPSDHFFALDGRRAERDAHP